MKFWREFMEKLNDIILWIREIRSDFLTKSESIENKLTNKENYIANKNPIKGVENLATLILAENEGRTKLIIQNIGLEPCYIKLDNEVSKDDYHLVLAPDTSYDFGNGGSVVLDGWHGEVYAICEKETKLSVLEY